MSNEAKFYLLSIYSVHDTAGEGTDVNKWLLLWRNVWFSGRKQGVSVSVQPAAIGAVMGAYMGLQVQM